MPPLYPYPAHEVFKGGEADEVEVLMTQKSTSGSMFVVFTGPHSNYLCATNVPPSSFVEREDGTVVNFIAGKSVFFEKYGSVPGCPVLVGEEHG